MSNFMHKVRDAMSGHKGSSHDSSQGDNRTSDTRDTYGSSNTSQGDNYGTSNTGGGTGNTYGSNTTGAEMGSGMGTGTSDSKMDNKMDTSNTYGSTTGSGNYGAGGYNTGLQDTKGQAGMGPSTMNTGDYSTGSNAYGSSGTGDYSGTQGPRESNMANKMDPRVDSSTGQGGMYTSDYGGSTNSPAYNTRSATTGSNMGQMDSKQRDMGGSAAGGSSYNTGRRRSSGPHSSNLLNKLDPRVKSSDYETAGNQRAS
ncbi:uncharacterized protein N7498_003800 [Penicillium cinerascens]|uniref:Uncharacterized protein n=1 Tax=Penicillium cinerascens TaxID=70096 RepID=A0A9W9N3M8_9EURO|nr:uncharacterized protein N7498_003800 [Penicillium cinerascens]KAJ5212154.1 hypothetical protein N7498_003800 [Penicillium cinerascens]